MQRLTGCGQTAWECLYYGKELLEVDKMYNHNAKEAVKKILRECTTEGTFWSRHFQFDDVIDIWRETNRNLIHNGEEPAPFDTFYLALQKFKQEYPEDFEAAAEAFIHKLETKIDAARLEREISLPKENLRRPPRVQKIRGGGIKVTGIFAPKEQEPIELTITSSEADWKRLYDYFNRYHDDFTHDLVFSFFRGLKIG
jgi:hypothetical protein